MNLLRRESLHLQRQDPDPPSIGSGTFVDWCRDRLDDLGPVHRWLVGAR